MADFCQECSLEHFSEDSRDLAGLCKPGEYVYALCEGCQHGGRCIVDHNGVCTVRAARIIGAELPTGRASFEPIKDSQP